MEHPPDPVHSSSTTVQYAHQRVNSMPSTSLSGPAVASAQVPVAVRAQPQRHNQVHAQLPPPHSYEPVKLDLIVAYFGTMETDTPRLAEIHPDAIHIYISMPGSNGQIICFQIAFKHVTKMEVALDNQHMGIFITMNEYSAKRIRANLQMDKLTRSQAFMDAGSIYFDPTSPIPGHKFVTLMIRQSASTNEQDLQIAEIRRFMDDHVMIRAWERQVQALHHDEFSEEAEFRQNLFVVHPRHSRVLRDRLDSVNPRSRTPTSLFRAHSSMTSTAHPAPAAMPIRTARQTATMPGTQRSVAAQQQQNQQAQRNIRPTTVRNNQQAFVASNGNAKIVVRAERGSQVIVLQQALPIGFQPARISRPGAGMHPQVHVPIVRLPAGRSMVPSTSRMTAQPQPRVVHHMAIDDDEDEQSESGAAGTSQAPVDHRGFWLVNEPGRDGFKIKVGDYASLLPEQFLNDVIIEWYLKQRILKDLIDEQRRSKIYIFTTFFWGKLSEGFKTAPQAHEMKERYMKIRNWTKSVDLFSMDYVVVPICEELHWNLAVIAFPGNAVRHSQSSPAPGAAGPMPYIVIFDSLTEPDDKHRYRQVRMLKDYLQYEWLDKRAATAGRNAPAFDKELFKGIYPKGVPQQNNYWDCGVYMLQYAELFLTHPPTVFGQNNTWANWFPGPFSVDKKRDEMIALIQQLSGDRWTEMEGHIAIVKDEVAKAVEAEHRRQAAMNNGGAMVTTGGRAVHLAGRYPLGTGSQVMIFNNNVSASLEMETD